MSAADALDNVLAFTGSWLRKLDDRADREARTARLLAITEPVAERLGFLNDNDTHDLAVVTEWEATQR